MVRLSERNEGKKKVRTVTMSRDTFLLWISVAVAVTAMVMLAAALVGGGPGSADRLTPAIPAASPAAEVYAQAKHVSAELSGWVKYSPTPVTFEQVSAKLAAAAASECPPAMSCVWRPSEDGTVEVSFSDEASRADMSSAQVNVRMSNGVVDVWPGVTQA